MSDLIGKTKYFVHKGTWENEYEWRIQKVEIRGVRIDKFGKKFLEFGFNCCGYSYPIEYLKDSLDSAKLFALKQITEEKEKQMKSIREIKSL